MRLRGILMILSFLTVLSAFAGGSLYYSVVTDAAFREAKRQARMRLEMLTRSISSFLLDNIKDVKTLAGMDPMRAILENPDTPKAAGEADALLDHFRQSLEADVCYVMNRLGITVASSNRNDPDSFVGQDFSFRPYFQNAISGWPTSYLALGITSGKRGVYDSHPIYGEGSDEPIGVAVIKCSIDVIENRFGLTSDDIVIVTDPRGVIFISNRGDWLFQLAWELPPEEIEKIAEERQFGSGPRRWIGLERTEKESEVLLSGERYLLNQAEIEPFPGWKVLHLRNFDAISRSVSDPFIRITGPLVLLLCALVGALVFVLYRKASDEILQRRSAEKALRNSEERYRSLYHNTPAMLHSIDGQGRLVSVSNYWAEALGYRPGEVTGRKLTDFMTEDSRRFAETTVFPEFFRNGACKDIPYRFVRRDGRTMDVLLSAIADRNAEGRIQRSLAVSIDVSERKRAEEALRLAKEELSRYSKDLERQVQLRTKEIGAILRYTPAVIYFKDREGRYLLVNDRYEELFRVKNEDVRGKTDADILPREVADPFLRHDREVLRNRRPFQVEERIRQEDGVHTYLSVKFPVFDESGNVRGVGGIATDMTAVKKAQDQLRRLSGSIMANQEKERALIARELHDELGQVLTALRMEAVWIQERLKRESPAIAGHALTMCSLIDKTIEDVRGLAFRLRPGILDDLGLVDALELYTSDFEKRAGITCIFDHPGLPAPRAMVATAAYRIVQEALTNVARHAEAAHVDVRMRAEEGFLVISVEDDGRGFVPGDLNEGEGLGLAGMRERALLVGGSLEMETAPGKGTLVRFRVPLEGADAWLPAAAGWTKGIAP
jgi:PAS domain S-box-containing protein